ncbi:MAG: porin [Magnetococcus sp. DMHC-8]
MRSLIKRRGVTIALLGLSLPAVPLLAEEQPGNAELYTLYRQLREELAVVRAENRALRETIDARQAAEPSPVGSPPRPDAARAVADAPVTPSGETAAPVPALRNQAVPLQAEFKKSYLTFRSADGNISYKLDGRIMVDAGFVQNDKDNQKTNLLRSNTEVRLASLAIKTTLYRDWAGKFDLNLADTTRVKIRDMTLTYKGVPRTAFTVGNHKPQFGMEELSSSRWTTFMESGLPAAFVTGRRIGASATYWEEAFSVGATVFGDGWDKNPADTGNAEGVGWAARVVGRPFMQDDANKLLHLGAGYLVQQPQSADGTAKTIKFSSAPEADFVGYKFLNTGDLPGTREAATWGLELAGKWDKYYAQSEYLRTTVRRSNASQPVFSGWYAMVAAFLTDDSRTYSPEDGYFGAVLPNGPWGALELALRYSLLDLNDPGAGVLGGKARDATLGVNWYVNNNIIFRANYIHVDNDVNATGAGKLAGDDTLNIYGARMEYLF